MSSVLTMNFCSCGKLVKIGGTYANHTRLLALYKGMETPPALVVAAVGVGDEGMKTRDGSPIPLALAILAFPSGVRPLSAVVLPHEMDNDIDVLVCRYVFP